MARRLLPASLLLSAWTVIRLIGSRPQSTCFQDRFAGLVVFVPVP